MRQGKHEQQGKKAKCIALMAESRQVSQCNHQTDTLPLDKKLLSEQVLSEMTQHLVSVDQVSNIY